MFIHHPNGTFQHIAVAEINNIQPILPSGSYRFINGEEGFFFEPIHTSGDRLVDLDTTVARKVKREVKDFFDQRITQRIASAGIKHRRGIILHGAPGTGKTSLVRAMLPYIVEHNAVVIVECDADILERVIIPSVRLTDPNRPICLVWDEFEKNANYSRVELLRLLDGLSSPDHLLTIATTNRLGAIPTQLRKRPSRFGLVLEMPPLDAAARLNYIKAKFPMMELDFLRNIIEMTDGFALDYLEEACKLQLMGYDTDEIRDRIHEVADTNGAIDEDDDDNDPDEEDEE